MFEMNGIVYAGEPEKTIKVTDAKVTGRKMMLLTFSTGEQRVFDADELTGEVYAPLDDPAVFDDFKIDHGAVTWADGTIDCAPEYMYEHGYAYDGRAVV